MDAFGNLPCKVISVYIGISSLGIVQLYSWLLSSFLDP